MSEVIYQVALQVRLDSQRLPGKALLPLAGENCLVWVLRHLRQSKKAERFLLLCPEQDSKILAPYANDYGFELFGGPKENVLQRFIQALHYYPSRYCFRATGDNPLLFGSLLDFMAEQWEQKKNLPDYYWIRGLPYGVAAELFRSEILLALDALDTSQAFQGLLDSADREHVTRFLYRNPQQYRLCYDDLEKILGGAEFLAASKLRLTLDTEEDYLVLQKVFTMLQCQGFFSSNSYLAQYIDFRQLLKNCLRFPYD